MKDKIGSKRYKIGECLGSIANALLFITVIVLQVMVIWNIGLMAFGNDESNLDEDNLTNEQTKANFQPMRDTKFNERRFEIEVIQPQQEMIEKFANHPNLVFNKLSKAIQKEDKRYTLKRFKCIVSIYFHIFSSEHNNSILNSL